MNKPFHFSVSPSSYGRSRPAGRPAWHHVRSFVLAPLLHTYTARTQSSNVCYDQSQAFHQRRIEPGRNTPMQRTWHLFDSSSRPRCASICSCSEHGPDQDQQRNARGQYCAASAKGHTGTRVHLADRAGVKCSSFRKGLGVPSLAGHPPPSVACFDAGCSYLRCSLLSVHSMLAMQSEMRLASSYTAGGAAWRGKCG
jgi:hypothetical protein